MVWEAPQRLTHNMWNWGNWAQWWPTWSIRFHNWCGRHHFLIWNIHIVGASTVWEPKPRRLEWYEDQSDQSCLSKRLWCCNWPLWPGHMGLQWPTRRFVLKSLLRVLVSELRDGWARRTLQAVQQVRAAQGWCRLSCLACVADFHFIEHGSTRPGHALSVAEKRDGLLMH